MDWLGARLDEQYIYREVTYPDLADGVDIPDIQGGTIDWGAFTDTKVSGSFNYVGSEPRSDRMIKVLYTFTDTKGEVLDPPVPVATLFVEPTDASNALTTRMRPDGTFVDKVVQSGEVRGSSVLSALCDDKFGLPTPVLAESNALSEAKAEAESYGLTVEAGRQSSYVLPNDKLYDIEDTPLKKINELLNAAGFRAAMPSKYGTVLFKDGQLGITPVFTFKSDGNSIKYPNVVETRNWTGSENCWKLYFANEEVQLFVEVVNYSGSPESTGSICGRKKTQTVTVENLPGDTEHDMLANLMEIGKQTALQNAGCYEYVKISHQYIPLDLFDMIQIDYPDRKWRGHVANMRIALDVTAKCDTEARMYVSGDVKLRITGRNLITGEEIIIDTGEEA